MNSTNTPTPQLYAALEPHALATFERLKTDRKVPIFEDGAEPGEVRVTGWAQDPMVHAEVKKCVYRVFYIDLCLISA